MSNPKRVTAQRRPSSPDVRGRDASTQVAVASSRRLWLAAVVIFAVALGLRLIYLQSIGDMGFFDRPVSDGLVFDQRAQAIAAGDLLGPADFVHAPLYAYVLGAVQWVAGHDLWVVRLVQMVLGSGSCVLLLLAGRRFFDGRAAVIAALLLAVYPPALFFDGLIQKTGLGLFLTTLLLWLLGGCAGRPTWGKWLGAGIVLGLLIVTRQNALALVPLLLAWLWIHFRGHGAPKRLGWTAVCAAGLVVALVPWAARNKVVTGAFVLTTPNLGQNFYMGNHLQATGTYVAHKMGWGTAELEQQEWVRTAQRETGRRMSAVEVSDHFLHKALEYIKSHPGHWLGLMVKKTLMVWNAYETFDTEDYYLYREWSGLLNVLDRVWHFGVLCPLAIAGVVLSWSRRRELWFLYGWLLITTVAVAVFVVFARYRFPLVPVLMMFASASVVTAVRLIRRREGGRLAPAAVALIVVAVAANWEVHAPRQPARAGYNNHCIILMERSRPQDALAEAERALDRYRGDPLAHLSAGAALTALNRLDEALGHLERARAAGPNIPEVHRCLGNALMAAGRPEEASEHYRQGLRLDPEDFRGLNGLAAVLAQLGRPGEAVELIRRAFEIQPTYAKGYLNLGNLYLMMNRVDEAVAAYREALRIEPDFRDALYNLGVVELQRGRPEAAVEPLRCALAMEPGRREARLALAHALVEARHLSEACALVQPVLVDEPVIVDVNLVQVVSRLAWVLATSPDPAERDGVRALSLARRACRLTDNAIPSLLRASAAALAEIGRFDQAVVGARLAIERAEEFGLDDLVEKIRTELASYEAGQPVRSAPQTAELPSPP